MIDTQVVKEIVNKYRNIYFRVRESDERNESYKWENLPEIHRSVFGETSNDKSLPEKANFLYENKENRVHYTSCYDFKNLVENNPDELAEMREELFSEENDLASRIDTFRKKAKELQPDIGLGTPLIGYLFAAYNPKKYPLFKNGIYLRARKKLGKNREWKSFSIGEKYAKFTELCEMTGKLLETELENSSVPTGYTSLEGQDFFYVMSEYDELFVKKYLPAFIEQADSSTDLSSSRYPSEYQELNVQVSFGKGTPAKVAWIGFLEEGQEIRNGIYPSLLYFKKQGLLILSYGVSEENTPSIKRSDLSKNQKIKEYFEEQLGEIPHRYGDSYVSKVYKVNNSDIDTELSKIQSDLSDIIQEYKSIITKKEKAEDKTTRNYWLIAPGPNAQHWEYFQNAGIIGIGWNELGNLQGYNNKKAIAQQLQELEESSSSQRNNAHACWEFANTIQIGDIVIAKQGTTTYLGWGIVTGEYTYDDENEIYYHTRTVDWEKTGERKIPGRNIVLKTLTNIIKYPDYVIELKDLLGITSLSSHLPQPMALHKQHPLNQILYGVPGTGKTYHTATYAVAIIEERSIEDVASDERSEVLKKYRNYKENGQIVFTTFHQSFGYEDFIEGLKAETDEEGQISYEIQEGVFKKIATKASEKVPIEDNFEEVYSQLLEDIRENDGELILETLSRGAEFVIAENRVGNLTLHANSDNAYSWTLKKEYLHDYLKDGKAHPYSPNYGKSVGEYIRKKYDYRFKGKQQTDRYVMIIDEINRGNISKIFGELITLLEPDKRIGASEERTVELPYSKTSFGVPSNLYVVGTMNTADRSIALMDIALRRRFDFVELAPDSNTITSQVDGIDVKKLFETINERITHLYDTDHQIGHSYFMNISTKQELDQVFYQKVIPLLQEYFYSDWEKIQIVLGDHKNQKLKPEDDKIIQETRMSTQKVLGFPYETAEDQYDYQINQKLSQNSYRGIYENVLSEASSNSDE